MLGNFEDRKFHTFSSSSQSIASLTVKTRRALSDLRLCDNIDHLVTVRPIYTGSENTNFAETNNGTPGNDELIGTSGNDQLTGLGGNDSD
jgi:Ca2+-binding RTX toxin-like protein